MLRVVKGIGVCKGVWYSNIYENTEGTSVKWNPSDR